MTLGIDVQGLSVRYDDVTAVDKLSFHLDGGKIYGLLGRNGAGKSTAHPWPSLSPRRCS